jgi:hypothetical protein
LGQLHTANIIVCFSVSGYLLYYTVSVVFGQLHTAETVKHTIILAVCNCSKTTETVQHNK